MITTAPYIELHKERNRRMGTFQFHDFAALREALPEYLRAPVTVAYYTGWRLASEILTRKKSHLVDDWLILETGEGKNEEPRRFPLHLIPELREVIETQLAATRELERREPVGSSSGCFTAKGTASSITVRRGSRPAPLPGSRGSSRTISGRTAATNLINANVDPLTAMALVGWKDISMLKRYRIIQDEPFRSARWKSSTCTLPNKKPVRQK